MADSYSVVKRIDQCWHVDGDPNYLCIGEMDDGTKGMVAVPKEVQNPQNLDVWLKFTNCNPRTNVCPVPKYVFGKS